MLPKPVAQRNVDSTVAAFVEESVESSSANGADKTTIHEKLAAKLKKAQKKKYFTRNRAVNSPWKSEHFDKAERYIKMGVCKNYS